MLEEGINSLKSALEEAVSVLINLLHAENEFIKLRSATEIINYCVKQYDNDLFAERLAVLEKQADKEANRWINKKG